MSLRIISFKSYLDTRLMQFILYPTFIYLYLGKMSNNKKNFTYYFNTREKFGGYEDYIFYN